jgi:hypothetical protein
MRTSGSSRSWCKAAAAPILRCCWMRRCACLAARRQRNAGAVVDRFERERADFFERVRGAYRRARRPSPGASRSSMPDQPVDAGRRANHRAAGGAIVDFLSADSLPWLQSAQQRVRAAFGAQRLPHSLLLLSAPGLGAEQLANWITALALCESPNPRPCGVCAVVSIAARGQPSGFLRGAPRGECAADQGRSSARPDRILVAQELSGRLQGGRHRRRGGAQRQRRQCLLENSGRAHREHVA